MRNPSQRASVSALIGIVVLATLGAAPVAAQDPLTAARFSLVIDGVEIAAFNELVQLTSQTQTDECPVSTDVTYEKLPTLTKPSVTLKRGLTGGMELSAWQQAVQDGQTTAARKSVSLILYNTDGSPVAKYFLTNAYPAKLEITALKAGSSQILYESVTLVSDRIQRVSPQ